MTSHLSKQTSKPAYYFVDCWISKQNDENDARKREDFETTRLTFFPSSTFETLCMFYFSQFLQSCSYKLSNITNQDLARATKKENYFFALRLPLDQIECAATGLQATVACHGNQIHHTAPRTHENLTSHEKESFLL